MEVEPETTQEIGCILLWHRGPEFPAVDLILPAGFGEQVWRRLIYAGAKAIGLDEFHSLNYEQRMRTFPNDFPSAPEYAAHIKASNAAFLDTYFRRHAKHRVNYEKLGSLFPLLPDPKLFGEITPIFIRSKKRVPESGATLHIPTPEDIENRTYIEPLHPQTKPNKEITDHDLR